VDGSICNLDFLGTKRFFPVGSTAFCVLRTLGASAREDSSNHHPTNPLRHAQRRLCSWWSYPPRRGYNSSGGSSGDQTDGRDSVWYLRPEGWGGWGRWPASPWVVMNEAIV